MLFHYFEIEIEIRIKNLAAYCKFRNAIAHLYHPTSPAHPTPSKKKKRKKNQDFFHIPPIPFYNNSAL